MTPAQAAYQAARQARAVAAGFTSYSQQYRAGKAGFVAGGKAYNAALTARRTNRIVAQQATGKLIGLAQTRAGKVIAADFTKQASAQWAAMSRLSNARVPHVRLPDGTLEQRHVTITIDGYLHGRALTLGGHGGYSLAFLRGAVASAGTWAAAVAELAHAQYPAIVEAADLDGTTVTVVIA